MLIVLLQEYFIPAIYKTVIAIPHLPFDKLNNIERIHNSVVFGCLSTKLNLRQTECQTALFEPSLFGMICGYQKHQYAITELVVPKSMPTTIVIPILVIYNSTFFANPSTWNISFFAQFNKLETSCLDLLILSINLLFLSNLFNFQLCTPSWSI